MNWYKKYLYKVEINPKKILFLNTREKLKHFAKQYKDITRFSYMIEWSYVAERYSGVEFNPYFYDMRFDEGLSFYYGIDIPSGYIWNKAGIKSITRLN